MNDAETTLELGGLRAVAVGDPEAARVVVVLLHGFQMAPADLAPFAHSLRAPAWFLFPEAPLTAEPRGRAWWHIDAKQRERALAAGPRDFAVQNPPDLPAARARPRRVPGRRSRRACVVVPSSSAASPRAACSRATACCARATASWASPRWPCSRPRASPSTSGSAVSGQPALRGLPVLVSHGEADDDLAFSAGEALRDCLAAAGAAVDWVPFAQGHEIPLVVWRRLRKLLGTLTSPQRA